MRYAQAARAQDPAPRVQHSSTAPSTPVDLRHPPPPAKRRPTSGAPRHHRPTIHSIAAPGFLKASAAGHRRSRRIKAPPLTAADVSQEDALWFSRLPEKVRRGQFTLEEQQLLDGRHAGARATPSPSDAADALFDQLRTARAARSGHHHAPNRSVPSLDSTHSSDTDDRASDRDSPVTVTDDEEDDMDAELLDRFRWLDDARDEPPLDLALDDYHIHVAATAERSSTKAPVGNRRPSYRRTRSIAGVALGGLESPTSPTAPRPRAATRSPVEQWGSGWAPAPAARDAYRPPPPPAPFGNVRFESTVSPTSGPKTPVASTPAPAPATLPEQPPPPRRPSLDADAAHYTNPEARRQLRLYLATPSKFDEALEFGFPALRHRTEPVSRAEDVAAAPESAPPPRPSLPEPQTMAGDTGPAAATTSSRGKPTANSPTTLRGKPTAEPAAAARPKRQPTLRARLEAYPSSSTLSSRPAHRRSHSLDAAAKLLHSSRQRAPSGGPRTTFLDDGTTTTTTTTSSSVAGRSSLASASFLPAYYSLPTPSAADADDDPAPAPASTTTDTSRLDLSPSTPSHSRTTSAVPSSTAPGRHARDPSISSFASFSSADAISDITTTDPRRRSAAPAFPSVSSLHTSLTADPASSSIAAEPASSPLRASSPSPHTVHPLRLHPASPPPLSPYRADTPRKLSEDTPSPTTPRTPRAVPVGRTGYADVDAPREMTLRMTLTRPDLRDPDAAWGLLPASDHTPVAYVGPGSGGAGMARRRPSLRERMGMERALPALEPWGLEEGKERGDVGGLRRLLSRRW